MPNIDTQLLPMEIAVNTTVRSIQNLSKTNTKITTVYQGGVKILMSDATTYCDSDDNNEKEMCNKN